MKISEAILAESNELPPIGEAMYQYVVAANGLFIRAEDSRMQALVQIAPAQLNGLVDLVPIAELKVERVPGVWLLSMLNSARLHMPQEAMYQLYWSGAQNKAVLRTWRCSMPTQASTPTAVRFIDDGEAVVDVHSHNSMPTFFSETDDADEQGLRFYAVIGRIDTATPEIRVRVGVYGHHMDVPADMIFDDLGPFVDATLIPDPSPYKGEGSDDPITGPMWAFALYARAKDGTTQLAAELIAATDEADAHRAGIEEAKHWWPEHEGYTGHDCDMMKLEEALKS